MNNDKNQTVLTLRYACSDFLNSPALMKSALEHVPQWCRSKAERLRLPEQRRTSLAASLLLEQALRQDYQTELSSLPVEAGPFGKPGVSGNALYFNLTHTGRWAFCATATIPVGVDAECTMPYDSELAQTFFEPEERLYLDNELQTAKAFTRVWVCRESYSKLLGCGLDGSRGFPILYKGSGPYTPNGCHFSEYMNKEWTAAVCWSGASATVRLCRETLDSSILN